MKIDQQEIQSLQATPTGVARVDIYVHIHKALRALMSDTLLAVGRLDTEDEQEFEQVSHRVLQLADACESHLTHENESVHTAMDAREPGASQCIAGEHVEHVLAIEQLRLLVARMRASQGTARARAALDLYRELAVFVGHNFVHMQVEETVHNGVLWARYRDEELLALNGRIVAQLPPEEAMFWMRWMIPALSPMERLQVLGGMKAEAPAEAFAAVLDQVRPLLDLHAWAKLAGGLGVAPQPGLVAA